MISQEQHRCVLSVWVCFWRAKSSGQIDALNTENGGELTELDGDLPTSPLPHQKLEITWEQHGPLPSSCARIEELNPVVRSTAWMRKTARNSPRYTPGGPYPHIGRWEPKRPNLLAGSWAGWRADLGWQFQGGGMCTEWSERNRRWGCGRLGQSELRVEWQWTQPHQIRKKVQFWSHFWRANWGSTLWDL